jgi:hypothetical protein
MEKKLSGKGLTSALFPTYVCGIVQRELKKALRYWQKLVLRKATCGKAWKQVAKKQKIPEAYWLVVKLPQFSVKSEPDWWDFLWPLIQKKIDLSKLPPLKLRKYDTVQVSMREGKAEVRESEKKERKRYPSDSETTAHDHLILLARLRDASIFY